MTDYGIIITHCEEYFHTPLDEMKGAKMDVVYMRKCLCYILCNRTKLSLSGIGEKLHYITHASVLYHKRYVEERLENTRVPSDFKTDIPMLLKRIDVELETLLKVE